MLRWWIRWRSWFISWSEDLIWVVWEAGGGDNGARRDFGMFSDYG